MSRVTESHENNKRIQQLTLNYLVDKDLKLITNTKYKRKWV